MISESVALITSVAMEYERVKAGQNKVHISSFVLFPFTFSFLHLLFKWINIDAKQTQFTEMIDGELTIMVNPCSFI